MRYNGCMSDKTPAPESAPKPVEGTVSAESAPTPPSAPESAPVAPEPAPKPVSPAPKEPKTTSAKPSGAKPETARVAPYAVFGTGDTDPISYSLVRPPRRGEGRKSLSVLHTQRRLQELGFPEGISDVGGHYGKLTGNAVRAYQASVNHPETGLLTREEFATIFQNDVNVTVSVDTPADHAE